MLPLAFHQEVHDANDRLLERFVSGQVFLAFSLCFKVPPPQAFYLNGLSAVSDC